MFKKLIWNDVRQNRMFSAAAIFFMTISAALLILTALLFTELFGTIDRLMDKAAVPDLMQMHAGEVDKGALARFAESRPEVRKWQLCRFLELDNSRLILGEHNMADSTQDNGLSVQSEEFDFLLGMDGEKPEILPGEVYVPVCYRAKYSLAVGDKMTVGEQKLTIAGFLRDAQMNAMMASSKRFLVNPADYEKMRKQGREEYLIEFLLNEGADVNALQTAYAGKALPAEGPAITRPLIRMINALSDGTMIFVLFLVSIIVLAISVLCIHFILSIQMERDRKEVGMLKALGIGRREIQRIYFAKYLLFSVCGGGLGAGFAAALKGPLARQLRELYGPAERGESTAAAALLAALLAEGIILFSIRRSLRKTDKLSALDALLASQRKDHGRTQYVLIGAVTAACTFLMLVPNNLYNTLSDPSFVTYMGIGSGELRIDVRQRDDGNAMTAQIAAALEQDTQVDQYAVLQTCSYPALLPDGSPVNLTVEIGDHLAFPVRYSAGTAPGQENEMALSALNAEELGLKLGDTLPVEIDGALSEFTVCGIYSDITNGGKTAKIHSRAIRTPVIWSVIYVTLSESAEEEAWMAKYRRSGVDAVRIGDYVQETYAQTLSRLRLASRWTCGIGALVIAVVLGLFSRLIVERSRNAISLRKALGFTGKECERDYFAGGMTAAVTGAAIGLLSGCLGGGPLCGTVLQFFGAEGFHFVIRPTQALVGIPLLVLGTAALAIRWGTSGIRAMKAYECCVGKE